MRIRRLLFLVIVLAAIGALTAQAAQVQKYLMTKPKPTAPCSELSASPPLGYMAFSTGEPEAYLWFYVTDLRVGDVLASEYYTPTGRLHTDVSGPFRPVESGGNWCFTDMQFKIAGALPASNQGVWTVKVTLNGAQLFSLNFTIGTMTIPLSPSVGGGGTTPGGGGAAGAFTNGGFELPGAGTRLDQGTSSTYITGWNITRGTVDYLNEAQYTCSEGRACIDLDGNTAGGVAQTFATTAGSTYQVTFDMAGNGSGGDRVKRLRVTAAGQSQEFTFDTTGRTWSTPGWTSKSWNFTANGASTTLEFYSLGPAGSWYGPLLDNVRIGPSTGGGGTTPGGGGGSTPAMGANLIVNPGAESGPSHPECGAVASIPGWTTAGIAAVCRHGWVYVPTSVPGPPDRGSQFFGGGYASRSSITQVVDLSSYAAAIDAGTTYALSAWLGGWETQGDNAKLTASFRSAGGSTLGAASVGPVTVAERNRLTAFLLRSASGPVPSGTRNVLLELEFNRTDGSQNDGYADNLSLTLGGGGATPPPSACSYNVPASSSVAGAGGTGMVLVTTAQTCTWTARSNVSWITVTAGASGTGNGAVSYRADANTGSSARTGTLTIAGITHTVTQGAGAASCTYSLNTSSASVAAGGGTTAVVVNTTSGCSWTASSNASWVTITAGASGSGGATVSLRVAANTSTSSRTGTVTVAGRTFTVTQAGQPAAGGPAITAGGVVNAASYISAALPSGAIAQGSFFSIFGTDLGPAQYAQATAYPIQTTLAEVSIRVTQGSTVVNALPVFVAATQINAVMPSNAPLGSAQVTVTYRGRTSAAATIRIIGSNFGAFSTAGGRGPGIFQNYVSPTEQPLNTRGNSAKPGQVVTLWGTGLGPITAPDSMAPPAGDLPVNVEVYVAGKLAKKHYSGRAPCCAGVDQIVFEIPADTPPGCTIPVQVKSGSAYSNIVTMAIHANGGACQETVNPLAPVAERGGKVGVVILARANASLELQAGSPPMDLTLDLGAGLFQEFAAGGELGYNPLLSYPPMGTCTNFSGNLDLGALLGSGTDVQDPTGFSGRSLNAGTQLTVTGPGGNSIPLPRFDEDSPTGPYGALLGGLLPIGEGPSMPLFLNPGRFTVRGTGGSDVGPFSVSLEVPRGVTWTDRNRLSRVDRTSGVSFNWTGGSSSQIVLLGGASADQKNSVAAGFMCAVPATQGNFTVPPNVLGNLPASIGEEAEQTAGVLMMGTIPAAPFQTFTASGLDQGLAIYFHLDAKTVPYR